MSTPQSQQEPLPEQYEAALRIRLPRAKKARYVAENRRRGIKLGELVQEALDYYIENGIADKENDQ